MLKQGVALKYLFVTATIVLGTAFAGDPDKIGSPAPPFSGTATNGEVITLSDYKGTVVLLDFWASWCGPCRQELPFMIDLYNEYHAAGFVILAVNIDDQRENAQAFLDELGGQVPFPVIVDPEKHLPALYEIEAMPTSVFIDKKGIVRYWHDGFKASDQQRYRDELTTLLNQN